MKQTIKTSRAAGYLEKMFRSLNDHYFNGEVEEPIITIQSTPKAYGHVTVSKTWHKNNGESCIPFLHQGKGAEHRFRHTGFWLPEPQYNAHSASAQH